MPILQLTGMQIWKIGRMARATGQPRDFRADKYKPGTYNGDYFLQGWDEQDAEMEEAERCASMMHL